jgi:hypothetical protein
MNEQAKQIRQARLSALFMRLYALTPKELELIEEGMTLFQEKFPTDADGFLVNDLREQAAKAIWQKQQDNAPVQCVAGINA